MNILLIGKQGQLGAELENIFKKNNKNIFSFGHDELDICDYQGTQKIIKKMRPDVVINASAYNVLPNCEKDPQKAFAIHAFALINLAEVCRDKNIKLVTYSTDYVFDGTKGKPYKENDRPNPIQIYGLSKLTGEIICVNYNPNTIIIRTCGVYGGIQGSRAKGNFVLMIIREAQKRKPLEISSEQIVSPTYARDLAEGTARLLKHTPARGIYHLINSGQCSWHEFAKEIISLTNITASVLPVDRQGIYAGVRRPLFSALENRRAKKLGITMPSWQDGLKRYLSTI